MANQSKYQDKQIDAILNDMIAVLEKHQAPVDLSLIVLGNMVTNLLNSTVGQNQRSVLAKAFAEALMHSVNHKTSS
ncbi:YejL family protein [Pasteurella sp. PK-2025]|uniref:YejL family protein n=1 Tax=unclassified Pasteurella TaxID=2621516 RepID=UPI003C76A4A7